MTESRETKADRVVREAETGALRHAGESRRSGRRASKPLDDQRKAVSVPVRMTEGEATMLDRLVTSRGAQGRSQVVRALIGEAALADELAATADSDALRDALSRLDELGGDGSRRTTEVRDRLAALTREVAALTDALDDAVVIGTDEAA